jgi:hypothetical protein
MTPAGPGPAEGASPMGAGTPSAAPAPPAKPRNRRLRLLLAMAAGIAALLCLGGVGVAIALYDEATQINREAPDAVVDGYLRAYLVQRDDAETAFYTCKSGGDFAEIQAYRMDIVDREARFSTSIRVTWEDLRVTTNGSRGEVEVDLTRSISDSESLTDKWRVILVDEDGWRVCGATKVG